MGHRSQAGRFVIVQSSRAIPRNRPAHKMHLLCIILLLLHLSKVFSTNNSFLYSFSPNDGFGPIKDEDGFAFLTSFTQKYIYDHQHPSACSPESMVKAAAWPTGMGSEMHVLGSQLAQALNQGKVLVIDSSSCSFAQGQYCGSVKGCDCFFRPVSFCSPNHTTLAKLPFVCKSGVAHCDQFAIPSILSSELRRLYPAMKDDEILYWWRMQSASYLMRLNQRTLDAVRSFRTNPNMHYFSKGFEFPLRPGAIHIHVRGSKSNKENEMDVKSAAHFFDLALKLVRAMPNSFSRTLIITSDDSEAIDAALRITKENKWDVVFSHIERLKGGFSMDDGNKTVKLQQKDKSLLTIEHLSQLLLALEASAWIGHRGSNWNRIIDELRCVWVPKCSNTYIEGGQNDFAWRR